MPEAIFQGRCPWLWVDATDLAQLKEKSKWSRAALWKAKGKRVCEWWHAGWLFSSVHADMECVYGGIGVKVCKEVVVLDRSSNLEATNAGQPLCGEGWFGLLHSDLHRITRGAGGIAEFHQ